ncbi:VOC family protein [Gracilibacillus phocaeensis]|uniref:VOC family protein n=1 Tax=Gracilibacillus phocaeensis TaxID=2042304 RepID=UPI001A9395F5|nr:VOC family protein [Gracilibacillus phocaeensis]
MTNIKDKITGLQHVGIPTQRLQGSIDFYESLGFECIHSVESGADHPTVVFMQLNALMIELYEEPSEAKGA